MPKYLLTFALMATHLCVATHTEPADCDPSDPDSAQALYELTCQLITENAARVALVKQQAQALILQELGRLESKRAEEILHKATLEKSLQSLSHTLGKDRDMHALNTAGRNVSIWATLGSLAAGGLLKLASRSVSAETATYWLDDPSSILFYASAIPAVVGLATLCLKIRSEHSITALEQKIATKESDLKHAENRIFDLETDINKLRTDMEKIKSNDKAPVADLYNAFINFKKNV